MANTTYLTIAKPIPGGSNATWGTMLNTALDTVDALFGTTTGHEHTGASGEGPKLSPLALAGVVTTNTGLLAAVSDTTITPRTLTAGSGIAVTNGTGVAGNPTVAVDIPGLTNETAIVDADTLAIYDASAAALREVTRANLVKNGTTVGQILHQDLGAVVANPTIDPSLYGSFSCTINGSYTWTFTTSGLTSGILYQFYIQIYSNAVYNQVWPASVHWDGSAPTSGTNQYDVVWFRTVDAGTLWLADILMSKVP